jgi:hypothetical protein
MFLPRIYIDKIILAKTCAILKMFLPRLISIDKLAWQKHVQFHIVNILPQITLANMGSNTQIDMILFAPASQGK